MVVAAIALVDVDATDLDAGKLLQIGDDGAEGVAVEWITVQGFGVQHELPALWGRYRRCDGDLAAELVGRPRLAAANALDLGGVQGIDLRAALPVGLMAHAQREIEQRAEALLQSGGAFDLAADIAAETAEPHAQELQRAGRQPE